VAVASDNTRDQFYAYGDLDLLEVFGQVRGAPPLPPLHPARVCCPYASGSCYRQLVCCSCRPGSERAPAARAGMLCPCVCLPLQLALVLLLPATCGPRSRTAWALHVRLFL